MPPRAKLLRSLLPLLVLLVLLAQVLKHCPPPPSEPWLNIACST